MEFTVKNFIPVRRHSIIKDARKIPLSLTGGKSIILGQNPARPETFYRPACRQDTCVESCEEFVKTYRIRSLVGTGAVTGARIYDIKPSTCLAELNRTLFDEAGDLVLKATPIYRDEEQVMNEVYNEIIVGAFINRDLVRTTVTPCFVQFLDWFKCHDPTGIVGHPGQIFQYAVMEKLGVRLTEYLNGLDWSRLMEALRCSLFMVFHALEVSFEVSGFIHYDLHCGNVLTEELKQTVRGRRYTTETGNRWAFQRSNGTWHEVDGNATDGRTVKIIDFNYSRMLVDRTGPKEEDPPRRVRTKVQFFNQPFLERFGIGEHANRTWDVRMLAWDLLSKLDWRLLADASGFVQETVPSMGYRRMSAAATGDRRWETARSFWEVLYRAAGIDEFLALVGRKVEGDGEFLDRIVWKLDFSGLGLDPKRATGKAVVFYLDALRSPEKILEMRMNDEREFSNIVAAALEIWIRTSHETVANASTLLDMPFFRSMEIGTEKIVTNVLAAFDQDHRGKDLQPVEQQVGGGACHGTCPRCRIRTTDGGFCSAQCRWLFDQASTCRLCGGPIVIR